MVTIAHEIDINAAPERIWDILWNTETYREWSQYFHKETDMRSDWKVAGRTYFLDETGNGLIATIESLKAPNEVVFKHLGLLQNGEEFTETKEIMQWSGNPEKYFITNLGDTTRLSMEIVVLQKYEDQIRKGFEKGFEKVKELAENF